MRARLNELQFLEGFEGEEGDPLVGPVLDGGCGTGFSNEFLEDFNDFIQRNLKTLGLANIIAGVVILLMLFASCVILWTKPAPTDDKVAV